jgi:hypothetical protein|tara:strand:+ start:381 stop:608 length:228 start_codon:yes stop_codon:yes gene_type:complete
MKSFDDFDPNRDIEPDPDLDEVQDDDWWHDLDPYGEEDPTWDPPLQDPDPFYNLDGITHAGYEFLSRMDCQGNFC